MPPTGSQNRPAGETASTGNTRWHPGTAITASLDLRMILSRLKGCTILAHTFHPGLPRPEPPGSPAHDTRTRQSLTQPEPK